MQSTHSEQYGESWGQCTVLNLRSRFHWANVEVLLPMTRRAGMINSFKVALSHDLSLTQNENFERDKWRLLTVVNSLPLFRKDLEGLIHSLPPSLCALHLTIQYIIIICIHSCSRKSQSIRSQYVLHYQLLRLLHHLDFCYILNPLTQK